MFLTDPKDDREALRHTKGSRIDGTCTWIKGHEVFKLWYSSDSELLWLSGGPGKGKTMISIYLVEELEQRVKHSENAILLQYFCDNKDERRNTATAILRGLIFQLLQARPHLFTHILPSYLIQKQSLFLASSFQTLWRIFEAMLRDPILDKTYCVIDGVDECEKDSLVMILDKFRELFRTNLQNPGAFQLNLIIASRDEPKAIPQGLSCFPRIRLDPDADTEVNQDVDLFIEAKVNELSTLEHYPPWLSEHIRKTFRERAQGTFLWVGIVANKLRNCSKTEVLRYLNEFPPGLNEVYSRILLGIEENHRREAVAKILRWTVMAVRPLTLAELSVAIDTSVGPSIDPSIPDFSPTEIAKDRISWCGNLLTITGDQVDLIHQSAKDYLLRKDVDSNPILDFFRVKEETANLEIASRCFYYLQEGALTDGPVDLEKEAAHLTKFPLLSYAVVYWPIHARSLARSVHLFDLSDAFYQEECEVRRSWLTTYPCELGYWSKPQRPCTLLHIASYFGLPPLAENLLRKRQSQHKRKRLFSLEERDGRGRTALHLAVEGRHDGLVRLLLNEGADVDSKCDYFNENCTALYMAVELGYESVTRVLLQMGADTEVKCGADYFGKTALHCASSYGFVPIVQLLLSNGADINARDRYQATALHNAATKGSDALVQLLLSNRADIHARDENQKTALHHAAIEGNRVVVQLLLKNGADINARDKYQKTALHWAAGSYRREREATVRLLLDKGADIEAKDYYRRTALHLEAEPPLEGC